MRSSLAATLLGTLALVAAGCGTGGLAPKGDASAGQRLFTQNCGSCHTLANAGTQGTVGPNLDAAFAVMQQKDYPESTIRQVVAKQIKYPNSAPATGAPGMPANLVKGADVNNIATYVACAAGVNSAQAQKNGCPAPAG